MIVRGEGWCSKEVLGPFVVGVWKYMRRGGEFFLDFLDLRWEMGQQSSSSMPCGVGYTGII